MNFWVAVAITYNNHSIVAKGFEQGLGGWIGVITTLGSETSEQATGFGNRAPDLMFQESRDQDRDHNEQGQASQALGRMQPHRPDLDGALNEINGLLDPNLLFVFDHHLCCRQVGIGSISTQQGDAVEPFALGDDGLVGFPLQMPVLSLIVARQGVTKLCAVVRTERITTRSGRRSG